jgi:hypothetical protein
MAKKINFFGNEVNRAVAALKDFHIEHVLVSYPANAKTGRPEKKFIIVLNKHLNDAKTAFEAAGLKLASIKNARHYENKALAFVHYQPQFDCKCRQCGKTFKSVVKEAVWCSQNCRHAHRIERLKARKPKE